MPTTRPWNVPDKAIVPTYDSPTMQAVHPAVLDMHLHTGGQDWHGWRYWMAMTPYTNTLDKVENPSIMVSQDGYLWTTPAGLTNPLYFPPSPNYFSDTHLTYDPVADELILMFRLSDGVNTIPRIVRSSDGVTWPSEYGPGIVWNGALAAAGQVWSPCLVRISASEWHLYGVKTHPPVSARRLFRWVSYDGMATWAEGPTQLNGFGTIAHAWHIDVLRHDGTLWMLIDRGPRFLGLTDGFIAASSLDGLNWKLATEDFMNSNPAYPWEASQLYRACIQPHDNPAFFRMWYSAEGPDDRWGTGYTQVAKAEWPTPPSTPTGATELFRDVRWNFDPDSLAVKTARQVKIGTPSATRAVVAFLTWHGSTRQVTGVTIGGITATQDYNPSAVSSGAGVWRATVPTGYVADIVVTMNSGGATVTLATYVYDESLTFVAGNYVDAPTGATTATVSCTSEAGGFALAGYSSLTAETTPTWAAPFQKLYDLDIAQPSSGADAVTTGASTTAGVGFSVATTAVARLLVATYRPTNPPASGGGNFTYLATGYSDVANVATLTVPGLNFGTPAADRVIVAAIGSRVSSGRSLVSVTIGGVEATIDKVTSTWPAAIIARAVVPTGTTGDVVITLSGAEAGRRSVAVYSAYGTVTVAGSGAHYSAGVTTSTTTVEHPEGASLIAAAQSSNTATSVTWTWTGLAENAAQDFGGSHASFASALPSSTAGPTTITAVSTAALFQGLAAVAYTIT